MSEKIQVVLPTKLAKEVTKTITEEEYENTSEFIRYVIQDYIWRKQHGLISAKAAGGI